MQRSACSLLKKQKYKIPWFAKCFYRYLALKCLCTRGRLLVLRSFYKMRIDDTIDNILDADKK